MNAQPQAHLLIVDDEAAHMKALCQTLELEGFATTGFTSAMEALDALNERDYDLVLTDLMMPEMDGIAFLRAAREKDPALVGIVMTGHGAIETAVQAMQAGALDYIQKPFRLSAVLPVLNRALAVRRIQAARMMQELKAINEDLERRVQERTRELEEANRDLESFSYSVSHDLRAPLRAIQGFCEIYMAEYGATIPPDGLPLLQRVSEGAVRMGQLIDDLLRFARSGRQALVKQPVSMQQLVARVAADLQLKEPERNIDLVMGELPDCVCDAALIQQVLVNLLSNAFKFTRGRPQAVIEAGGWIEHDKAVYFVRDNGAGFDMRYAGKLFGVFQRLHSATEFDGTGVGLSIVQRIIHRHGGTVWAESEVDRGATFYFSIPLADATRVRAPNPHGA